MNLIKCENGHYYDGDQFAECPHCRKAESGTAPEVESFTVPLDDTGSAPRYASQDTVPADNAMKETASIDPVPVPDPVPQPVGEKTIGFYSEDVSSDPVVGWLVCISGSEIGKSFNLKAGKNFIGRSNIGNDIVLRNDNAVSREKHAILVFDPKSRRFIAQQGMSSELFYLNDEVVLQPMSMRMRDVISVGNTKLMFVPFCGEDFMWEDYL